MTSTLTVGDWSVWRAESPRSVRVDEHLIVDLNANGRILQVTNLNGATISLEDLLTVLADVVIDRSWGMHE